MLTPEEKKSIIDYRRQKAYDNLNEAKEVAKLHFWNLTGNLFIMLHFTWLLPYC